MSLNKKIVFLLKRKKFKLSIAESCTGGLLSSAITSVSGSSKVFPEIPIEGIGLIFAVDRILDMCRTTVNVTGDATVASIIAYSENEMGEH